MYFKAISHYFRFKSTRENREKPGEKLRKREKNMGKKQNRGKRGKTGEQRGKHGKTERSEERRVG